VAVENLVVNYDVGQTTDALAAFLNSYGVDGWRLTQVYALKQNTRRGIFVAAGTTEYLVVDYDTGQTPGDLESFLDGYGADGWEISQIDMLQYSKRRAIFMRGQGTGGGGGGIEEAPLDDVTYGRRNASWNPALALDNDTLDGGNF
jgi:hypothetical protein